MPNEVRPKYIAASQFLRCVETSVPICNACGKLPVHVEPVLGETSASNNHITLLCAEDLHKALAAKISATGAGFVPNVISNDTLICNSYCLWDKPEDLTSKIQSIKAWVNANVEALGGSILLVTHRNVMRYLRSALDPTADVQEKLGYCELCHLVGSPSTGWKYVDKKIWPMDSFDQYQVDETADYLNVNDGNITPLETEAKAFTKLCETHPCDLCKEEEDEEEDGDGNSNSSHASVFCPDCYMYLCADCDRFVHEKPRNTSHKKIGFSPLPSFALRCPSHPLYPLDMFCLDDFGINRKQPLILSHFNFVFYLFLFCIELCCTVCRGEGKCNGHNVKRITDAWECEKSKFCDLFAKFKKLYFRGIHTGKKLSKGFTQLSESAAAARACIIASDKLTEETRTALLSQLNEEEERFASPMKELYFTMHKHNTFAGDIIKWINKHYAALMGTPILFFSCISEMHRVQTKTKELCKMLVANAIFAFDKVNMELDVKECCCIGDPDPAEITTGNRESGDPADINNGTVTLFWNTDGRGVMENVYYLLEVKKSGESDTSYVPVYKGKEPWFTYDLNCVHSSLGSLLFRISGFVDHSWVYPIPESDEEAEDRTHVQILASWCKATSVRVIYHSKFANCNLPDFHEKCDNTGPTLLFIHTKNGYIFGGFSTAPWAAEPETPSVTAPGSFLFTLTNPYGVRPTKFPLANEHDHYALYPGTVGFGKNDLVLNISAPGGCGSFSGFPNSYVDTTKRGFSIFTGSTTSNNFEINEIVVAKVTINEQSI